MFDLHLSTKSGTTETITVYSPAEIMRGCVHIPQVTSLTSQKYHRQYYNVPVAFDIETSHISENGDTFTWMYHWQFCIGETVIFGRTWEEFDRLLRYLVEYLNIGKDKHLIIFVHNLAYEFAFFKLRFPVIKVFARENNKPLTGELGGDFLGIEFRCTESMSGYSLAKLAENTPSCRWIKDKGELDYSIVRTSATPLTPTEAGYCAKDVLIPCAWVQSLIDREHRHIIGDIPITKTGFVRRSCRQAVKNDREWNDLRNALILDAEQFIAYNRAFRGGDTHCAAIYNDELLDEVYGYDISSSYPTRIVMEDFPLSRPITLHRPDFSVLNYLDDSGKLYVIDLAIANVHLKSMEHYTYIPVAKCEYSKGVKLDNGRVAEAEYLHMTVCSTDLEIIRDNYDFEIVDIYTIIYHNRKGRLPKVFVDYVLKLYAEKTTLKGVPEKEVEYAQAKEHINSVYGMCVTNPLNDTVTMDFNSGEWETAKMRISMDNAAKIQEELDRAYKSPKNFLPYEIGVWVAAWARYDLHRALRSDAMGSDAVYWDTDSVKFIHRENRQLFDRLNEEKVRRIEELGYTLDEIAPMDINGHRHMLGLWDEDYIEPVRFWSIGAKKYATADSHGQHLTVAGLNGKRCVKYLEKDNRTVFDLDIGDTIPEEWSGRTLSEYINEPFSITIDGITCEERSYQNIIPTTYTFGVTEDLKMYAVEAKHHIKERTT